MLVARFFGRHFGSTFEAFGRLEVGHAGDVLHIAFKVHELRHVLL